MSLTAETTEWVRALLQQEIGKAVAPLRQEIDQADDWASGVLLALQDVVDVLGNHHLQLTQDLMARWRPVAERYARLQRSQGQAEDFHETLQLLEARKVLYGSALSPAPGPGT